MNFGKCKVGNVPLQCEKHRALRVAHFIKSCIIHTPKKLSNGCAAFYKWYNPYKQTHSGSGPLTWGELIWSSQRGGGGSPESRFPTSPLLALPAKKILCLVTNGRGVLGRRQCGGGPLHLPPTCPPFSPTIQSAAAVSSPITIIVF